MAMYAATISGCIGPADASRCARLCTGRRRAKPTIAATVTEALGRPVHMGKGGSGFDLLPSRTSGERYLLRSRCGRCVIVHSPASLGVKRRVLNASTRVFKTSDVDSSQIRFAVAAGLLATAAYALSPTDGFEGSAGPINALDHIAVILVLLAGASSIMFAIAASWSLPPHDNSTSREA